MKSRTLALICSAALTGAVLTTGCSETQFPATPTPVANLAPVVNLGGGNYQGSIALSNGTTTSFNMTLIARGLGVTTRQVTAAQAPGTVEVTGSFETGTGLRGSVRGLLEGTLENGTFQGNLDVPDCSRGYAGPITASGFAWTPTGNPVPGCPLTFVIQIPRPLGPGCTYTASPSRSSFSGNGGTATVNIVAQDRCVWAAESLVPWISIEDPLTGTGAGKITFKVAANTESPRQGTMRVAGQTIGIKQGSACSFSVAPSTTSVPGSGGTGNITVTTPDGCEWTASSGVDWLTVSAATGSGGGVLTFTAQPNAGPERKGTLQVAGHTVTVTQRAVCNFSVTPASLTVPAAGGSGTIAVTGPAGCQWNTQSDQPWVTVSPASDSGDGTVNFTAQPNTGPQRQATLRVAGRNVTVTQQAAGCVYSVSPPTVNFTAAGGPGSVTVSTQGRPECTWTVRSTVSWIEVTGTGAGDVTVPYRVAANPEFIARNGAVEVIGTTATVQQVVTQDAAPSAAITLSVIGTGEVRMPAGDPAVLTCTSGQTCQVRVSPGPTSFLAVVVDDNFAFGSWSGCTPRTQVPLTCDLNLVADTSYPVSATFFDRRLSRNAPIASGNPFETLLALRPDTGRRGLMFRVPRPAARLNLRSR